MRTADQQPRAGASEPADNGDRKQLGALRELLSEGEILPSQLASTSHWSAELRLAAAVLSQAMSEIRLRRPDQRDHVQVAAALRWVNSNDGSWPLSFLRICELLQLDAGWVRGRVTRWLRHNRRAGRGAYRHAA
jgi:hypothetical protein